MVRDGTELKTLWCWSKEPVLCYTCLPTHTRVCLYTPFIGRHYITMPMGERSGKGRREPFLFLKASPYSSFLELIFLTHIIMYFLEEISQNVCNLYSRYFILSCCQFHFFQKEIISKYFVSYNLKNLSF